MLIIFFKNFSTSVIQINSQTMYLKCVWGFQTLVANHTCFTGKVPEILQTIPALLHV